MHHKKGLETNKATIFFIAIHAAPEVHISKKQQRVSSFTSFRNKAISKMQLTTE